MKPLKRGRPEDADIDDYIPTDSDDEYTEAEKKILAKTRQDSEDDNDSEEDVYGVLSSGAESDLDDPENDGLPDVRAWGKTKNNFYSTDYVDQDFGGFQGKDGEEADHEEREARSIQQRLAKELDDQDFSFDVLIDNKASAVDDEDEDKIKTDLTKLSKRQKLALFHKESPEFSALVENFKIEMSELKDKLEPIMEMIKEGKIPDCPARSLVKTKYYLTLNYCTNISFYLLLKARRKPVQSHPIVRRLVQYRQLLQQIAPLWTDIVEPQVDQLLEAKRNGQEVNMLAATDLSRADKKRLKLLEANTSDVGTKDQPKKIRTSAQDIPSPASDEAIEEDVGENVEDEGKRAITRQIAKNKGLTPRRKKEQRNPRVKNRNKYRKAQIQRRGQVRTVRKETERYGGEISGIKSTVKKGIKIKV